MNQKVNSTGVTFQGRGANESLRIYLYPPAKDGKWTSILNSKLDEEEERSLEAEVESGRILYFRLKSSQSLTIKCSTVGRMKIL